MNQIYLLIAVLVFLVLVSAFFSASETSMMALNRYRLRHLVREKNQRAMKASLLLERPDRLLSVILIGNNFANILASAIATLIAVRFYGDLGALITSVFLTLIILIFGEITPKTLAVIYPERIAFPASPILTALLKLLSPLVLLVNGISSSLLRIFNIKVDQRVMDHLTHEELRTVLHEGVSKISPGYKHMMLGVLELGAMTVDDIKVPRNDIVGIDLDQNWEIILKQLLETQHNRLPLYRENIDRVLGILHIRKILNLLTSGDLDKKKLIDSAEEAYFIPEGTPLNVQLINFKKEKRRMGLIVDEYGDIEGLATLEDILEEIVGEFTTTLAEPLEEIQAQKDGSYLVDGGISVRDLNRRMNWELPTEGPNTLSGLIIDYLETIPTSNVALRIAGYPLEVKEMEDTTIKWVQIWPKLRIVPNDEQQDSES